MIYLITFALLVSIQTIDGTAYLNDFKPEDVFHVIINVTKANSGNWNTARPILQKLSDKVMSPRPSSLFPRAALPKLSIDKSQTSISGLSSGGYMTVQVHMALSKTFPKGAGVYTGGPLYCTEGNLLQILPCTLGLGEIDTQHLINNARDWASRGLLDPLENLRNAKVYLFRGTEDNLITSSVLRSLRQFYSSFVPDTSIRYRGDLTAGHGWAVDHYGVFCPSTNPPFINRCNMDTIGEGLQHIYGPLNPRNTGSLTGRYIEFEQDPFITGGDIGLSHTGHVYIPAACMQANAGCRLHVVLHGCMQNHHISSIDLNVVRNAGYNMWADTNKIVMLYPQTGLSALFGCWDFFGYESNDFANNRGPQIRSIKAMVDHISSG